MMMTTGLSMLSSGMGGVLQSNSMMNMMWMYGLMMKMNMMNETMSLGVDLGLWNGMVKMSNNELMMGMMMMMLSGMMTQYNKEGVMMVLMLTGMWMATMSKEWMSMMLSMELQSSGMYMLVCKSSMSSGLSYNMMGGVSSSMMMMSWLSMYSESGLSNMEEMKMWEEGLGTFGEKNGMMLGMLMKMGTGPMHNWMSDVMENMGSEENKWVGGMSKMPLMKMMNEWNVNTEMNMMPMMLTLGMGGMLGSTAYSMKKFMAYSGMHNLGYVLMMSKSDKWMFFMTQYVMTLMSMLTMYKENSTMWSMKGSGSQWVGMTMMMSMLSSMGMPPLMGFKGKLSMMEWVVENGWWMTTGMMMMGSVMSGSNYMSMVKNATETNMTQETNKSNGLKMSMLGSLMVTNMVESYTQCI